MAKLIDALWRDIMAYLRRRHSSICRQWFEQLEPRHLDSGVLTIRTANSVQQNYLQRKCIDPFNEAAQAAAGRLIVVRFVTTVEAPTQGTMQTSMTTTAVQSEYGTVHAPSATAVADPPPTTTAHTEADEFAWDQTVISPDHCFDNFVCGPCNQMALAASVAVGNHPSGPYNPLFIYGGSGLGKTHLLQAICQSIMQNHAGLRIGYLSCETFMNDFLACVRNNTMDRFRNRYRQVDVLVLDDIHFLGRRERSQEEFFHTFNALRQHDRQIVLSSDSLPSEIPQLEERLISRFKSGMVAHVTKPCYETRVAILEAKAKLHGVAIPREVIDYLAERIDTNTHELGGALNTVHGHATLLDHPIDLGLAREALGDPIANSRPGQITLQNITALVTAFYNVKLSDLQSKRRLKSITQPRQICMWLARKHTRFSLKEIGYHFGKRDHTTVMHATEVVDKRIATKPNFANDVEQLEQMLLSDSPH